MAKKPFKRRTGGDSEMLRRMFEDNQVEQVATFARREPDPAPEAPPVETAKPTTAAKDAAPTPAKSEPPDAKTAAARRPAPVTKPATAAPRRRQPEPVPAAEGPVEIVKFTFSIAEASAENWVEAYIAHYGRTRLIRSVARKAREALRQEITAKKLTAKRSPETRAKRHLAYETTMNLAPADLDFLRAEYDPIGIMTARDIVSAAMTDAAHAVIAAMRKATAKRP